MELHLYSSSTLSWHGEGKTLPLAFLNYLCTKKYGQPCDGSKKIRESQANLRSKHDIHPKKQHMM
jgi:hypothetical protein